MTRLVATEHLGAILQMDMPQFDMRNVDANYKISNDIRGVAGTAGNDWIKADDRGNHLWAAAGNDTLLGGLGSDTFYWGTGDGNEVIQWNPGSSNDKICFYNKRDANDLLSRQENNDLIITNPTSQETLTVKDWYSSAHGDDRITSVTFSDEYKEALSGKHRFKIELDYRFDTTGYWTQPMREAAEWAADQWEDRISDDFPTLYAGETVTAAIGSGSGRRSERVTLDHNVDDMLIFLSSDTSYQHVATTFTQFQARNHELFERQLDRDNAEPAIAGISFSSQYVNESDVDATPAQVPYDYERYGSVQRIMMHEIGHALGIGNTSYGAWAEHFDRNTMSFMGPATTALYGPSGVPMVDYGGYHVDPGFAPSIVTPSYNALRNSNAYISQCDLAILQDMGYQTNNVVGYR